MKNTGVFSFYMGSFFLLILSFSLSAQPQGFNYQAVARSSDNSVLSNQALSVFFSLLDESEALIWKESHDITTNEYGIFNVIICNSDNEKMDGSAASLTDIPWKEGQIYLKVEVDDGSNLVDMGTNPLMAVPYALVSLSGDDNAVWSKSDTNISFLDGKVGVGTMYPEGKLTIQGQNTGVDEPIFMVSREDGFPLFAVYEHGVYAYVDEDSQKKGTKGGFAVGGYNRNKGINQEYMRITSDSIRFYVKKRSDADGTPAGFSIGEYDTTNLTTGNEFLRITSDSIRLYINDEEGKKGIKGGFAVGGYNRNKAPGMNYFHISGNNTADVIEKSQSRILWYPRKEAFMAGRVLVQSADSVGTNSFSTGFESKAIGDWSQSFGYRSVAKGNYSTAIGKEAKAEGLNSFAFGGKARASSAESFAFGRESEASGLGSFALGYNANATGEGSYAMGAGTVSSGIGSFALGFVGRDSSDNATGSTAATGHYSVAIGMGSTASNKGAFSIGTQTTSSGYYSYAIGYRTISSGWYSLSTGYSTTASGNFSTSMGYGSTASGAHSLAIGQHAQANDWYSMALGFKTLAEGQQSIAIGSENVATGNFSLALGKMSTASGTGAVSIGFNTSAGEYGVAVGYGTNAEGMYSTSMGYNTHSIGKNAFSACNESTAEGNNSVAFGSNTLASGPSSFTAGQNTLAGGAGSVALGILCEATGNYSTASGYQTTAGGDWSFAAGQYTNAATWNCFAMGAGSRASGYVSTAFGRGTVARPFASFVIGQYNDSTCSVNGNTSWVDEDPLFIIGNGDMSERKNAMLVRKNGELLLPDTYGVMVSSNVRDLFIDDAGKIGYVSSSLRYKDNISDMEDIQWLYELRPVNFTYKESTQGETQYGLIAEEVESVNSKLVSYNSAGEVETVSYSKLLIPILKAVQDQEEIIQTQQEELERKDAELNELRERLERLEKVLNIE